MPSKNSRLAPPPVEMWLILAAKPDLLTALTESPPPMMLTAPLSATALQTPVVPPANFGISKQPMGPFHTTVSPWPHAAVGEDVTVFGPDAASATDLAETIGTVGEEILVRVSPLVPRVYRGE